MRLIRRIAVWVCDRTAGPLTRVERSCHQELDRHRREAADWKQKYEQLLATLSDQDFHVCEKCQRIVQGSCLDCLVLSK